MNRQNFKNDLNKFPVSVDTLDFMQEQIKFVSTLSGIAGGNAILKQSTSNEDGLLVLDGELLLIKKSAPNAYITITEEKQSIVAKGETFTEARVIRYAQYTSNSLGGDSYEASRFKLIENWITEKAMPKGTVIDWYGEASCDNIPYGWVPCGGFAMTSTTGMGTKPNGIQMEENKWKELYETIEVKYSYRYRNGTPYCFLHLDTVNGMEIPNLSGRFIVGAGHSDDSSIGIYASGEIGGENFHRLTALESGLPEHTHSASGYFYRNKSGIAGSKYLTANLGDNSDSQVEVTVSVQAEGPQEASAAHENRPPYFALYKLIKVI